MSFLARLTGRERRAAPAAPIAGDAVRSSDPFLAEYLGLGRRGGRTASPDEAVASLAVAARCVSLISEALAALPLRVYRRLEDGGRELAPDHPLDSLLNVVANDSASAFAVREGLVADVLTSGNGYLRQQIDRQGRVAALFHLPRPWVTVERLANGRLRYRVSEPVRGTYILTQDQALHLRYRTRDGIMGVGPLEWAGVAVGLAVAQTDLAQAQVDRGFTSDMAFETGATFGNAEDSNAAFQRLKRQLTERLGKLRAEPTALLLEAGLSAKPLASNGREAQFHESRLTGMADIARIFGVPLSVVGLGDHASYGSLTEESAALVRNCFAPWARKIEAELVRSLLTTAERAAFEIEHDLSGFLRGDLAARFASYATGVQWSILSPNDCRRAEGLASRPGGDAYLQPVNMAASGEATGRSPPDLATG